MTNGAPAGLTVSRAIVAGSDGAGRKMNGHRSAPKQLGDVLAFDQLHHERAIFDAVDLRDVRVIERRERFGFALKPGQPLGVGCDVRRKHFQRDVPLQFRVFRAIDLAHSSSANRGGDFVGANPGTRGERHGMGGL